MANPAKPETTNLPIPWGTLEELLLACAVHRHGTDSWDSVSNEIHKRCSHPASFTSLSCKQRFHDLKRRFAVSGAGDVAGDAFPWLDELRRRRIAELKLDLERYDSSIVSLQSKVKRLSEEREKSLTENGVEASDLQGAEPETPAEPLPVNATKGSDPAEEGGDAAAAGPEEETKGSCDGSTDRIAVGKGTVKCEAVGESVAESKREEAGPEKETGEVESFRKSGGAEKWGGVKSQALADFLDVIRDHEIGSVFGRRLDVQESSNYKDMIRQHVDLPTIRTRLEEGQYAQHSSKFYRDLLLLATNAALFFPKSAPEHTSATELRQLISAKLPRHPISKPQPKQEPETSGEAPAERPPPVLKPKLLSPVIVCRKRSSVVLKPSSGEKKRAEETEKPSWFSAVTKKRTRDQGSVSRSSGTKVSDNKSSSEGPSSKEGSGDATGAAKLQKKKSDKENNSNVASSGGEKKKKSVASFLNRIRKSTNETSDSLKSGSNANSKSNSKGGEVRKNGGGKSEPPSKGSPASVKGKQKEGANGEGSKRNLGRPPKRVAAVAGVGKRRREGGDEEVAPAAPKKKSRK